MFATQRRKALGLFCLAVVAFVVLAIPRVAFAKPCQESHYWYYADSSCSEIIGGGIRDCDGGWHTWGTVMTPHYDYAVYCCENEDCGENWCELQGIPYGGTQGCSVQN